MELYKHSASDVMLKVNGLKQLLDTIEETDNEHLIKHYIESAKQLSNELYRELRI